MVYTEEAIIRNAELIPGSRIAVKNKPELKINISVSHRNVGDRAQVHHVCFTKMSFICITFMGVRSTFVPMKSFPWSL